MADDNRTTGVMDSPAPAGSSAGNGLSDNPKNPFSKLSNPASGSKTYRIGPDGFDIGGKHIVIDYLVAQGRTPRTRERGWVKAGSLVTVAGKLGNLRTFDRAALWIGQVRRPLLGVKFENYQIVFKVPDNIGQLVSTNGTIAVELGNGKESGVLSDFLVYKPEEKKEEEKEGAGGGKGGRAGGKTGTGGGFGKGAVDALVNIGGEVLQKSLGTMVGVGVGGKTSAAQSKQTKPGVVQISKSSTGKQVTDESGSDYEETVTGGGVATEAVGGEVGAMASTEVSGTIEQSISGTAAQTAEVTGHAETSVSGSATVSGTAKQTIGGGAAVAAPSVSATVTGETIVKAEGRQSVSEASMAVNSTESAAAQTQGGLSGSLSLKQSMEIVGEHLDKNPELIMDAKLRENVQQALGSGNLGDLSAEGRATLQKVAQTPVPSSQTGALRLQAALQNVNGALARPSGQQAQVQAVTPSSVPAGTITAGQTRPVTSAGKSGEAEQGLKLAEKVEGDLSGALPKEPQKGQNLPQQGRPQGIQDFAQPAAAQADQEGVIKEAVEQPAGAEAEQVGKLQTPQEKEAAMLAQAAAKAPVPPQYAAMIGNLAEKDKAREAVAGLNRPEPGAIKEEEGEGGAPKISDKLPPTPKSEGSQKEPSAAGSKASSGTDGAPEKPPAEKGEALEVAPPLNPEKLSQAEQSNTEGQEPKEPGEDVEGGEEEGGGDEEADAGDTLSLEVGDRMKQFGAAADEEPALRRKKEEAAVAKVVKEANLLIDKLLTQAAVWVWGAALPSLGFSILLGAIVGDFLWMFKGGIYRKILTPLLKTEFLKQKAQEISRQIKISRKVKLNILGMNAAVLGAILAVVVALFILLWTGCNYPFKGPLSIISKMGYGSVCDSINSMASNISSTAGGMAPIQSLPTSYTGSCSPAASGPASVANLQSTCFGYNAPYASAIANAESGGNPASESRSDVCKDGNSFSIGLFQINLIANGGKVDVSCVKDKIFNINGSGTQGNCVQRNSNGVCVKYDCEVKNLALYNTCKNMLKDSTININVACKIYAARDNWSAWGANNICKF